ncbi:hypothetical protein [Hymenobacter baengnokdamensis]|uniref:hypothetical protein n=1 Tax=Hymenobacter baengnokdamensis TaxID=2615203 RepID=UPI001243A8EF|nr:hypothetical protein [Hymenobacter baengnokdamensis]
MKPKFKFNADQIDAVKGSIEAFQNQAIKDVANNYVVSGGAGSALYSQGHYSQNYSRGTQEPEPIIVA